MSEEEKKAIESLIEIREFANLSSYKDIKISQLNAIGVVLNLIEKQQKEIEELKEDNKHQWEERCKLTFELKNSTSNDKIKAKIEEYEQDVKDFEEYWSKDPRKFKKEKSIDYYKLEALKELLEKE